MDPDVRQCCDLWMEVEISLWYRNNTAQNASIWQRTATLDVEMFAHMHPAEPRGSSGNDAGAQYQIP